MSDGEDFAITDLSSSSVSDVGEDEIDQMVREADKDTNDDGFEIDESDELKGDIELVCRFDKEEKIVIETNQQREIAVESCEEEEKSIEPELGAADSDVDLISDPELLPETESDSQGIVSTNEKCEPSSQKNGGETGADETEDDQEERLETTDLGRRGEEEEKREEEEGGKKIETTDSRKKGEEEEQETDQQFLEVGDDEQPLRLKPVSEMQSETTSSRATDRRRKKTVNGPKISYSLSDDEDEVPVFSWKKEQKASPALKPKLQTPKNSAAATRQAMQPHSTRQTSMSPPRERSHGPSMFVTEIEDEDTVKRFDDHEKVKRHRGDDLFRDLVEVKHEKDEPRPVKKQSCKPKTRMTPAMMQFTGITPAIPVTKQIDLSKYDDEDFDWQEMSRHVPRRLLAMITQREMSIVFRAICGVSMVQYSQNVVSRVLLDLKKYLNMCVEKGLIGESSYMQCIIEGIKDERKEVTQSKSLTVERMNERLNEAEESWKSQKAILEAEKDLSLEDMELKFQDEAMRLDEEWNTEHMQAKFNKPSPTLIEMRHNVKSLMSAHRFEEAALVAEDIAKREAMETEEAALRMRQAYQQANERLKQQFESDRQVMIDSFESKRSGLVRAEESNLRPLSQRIEKYQKMKCDAANAARRSKSNLTRPTTGRKSVMVSTKHAPVVIDAKLKLPPLGHLHGRPKPQIN